MPAGDLREQLVATAENAGVSIRDFFVWRTAGSLVNAAVVGFLGRGRYVLLTDSLLRHFTTREIQAVLLHEAGHVRRWHLPLRAAPEEDRQPPDRSLADVERVHIERVLEELDGNITQAAKVLGIDRATLYNKLKRYGIRR